MSFGVYVTLADNGYTTLRPDIQENLEHQMVLIDRALRYLEYNPLPLEYAAIHRMMLQSARDVIGEVLAAGEVVEEMVIDFSQKSAPWYLESAGIGAKLEIETLHDTVMNWRDRVGDEHWENIYVVICAAHQGRYRETTLQYFQRLLYEQEGLAAENEDRVIYAEHIDEPQAALELLARHIVDQRASLDLFDSPTRLQEDLMADGAATYLEELLPN